MLCEIQVVRKDNSTLILGRPHYQCIRRGCLADGGPVLSIKSGLAQVLDPARGQVHVDNEPHAVASVTSRSSANHAA